MAKYDFTVTVYGLELANDDEAADGAEVWLTGLAQTFDDVEVAVFKSEPRTIYNINDTEFGDSPWVDE